MIELNEESAQHVPNDAVAGEEADNDVFAMLQDAVNTARNHQVKDVVKLRKLLIEKHPKQESDVDAALDLWKGYVKSRGPAALPRMR